MLGLPYNILKLVSYDAEWVKEYNEEAERIKAAINDASATICHIGSTAVPGMVSKPIIDIMLGVDDMEKSDYYINNLEQIGYNCLGECGRIGRIFFVKGGIENCTHHLHLVEKNSEYWIDNIMFRDYLIRDNKAASEYAGIKVELEKRFRTDRDMYRLFKSEYVEKVIKQLKEKCANTTS
ncbi:MAG: GrpB family protein [Firmicutes bacterium]|nr:GrpB family protein [Bacillota bacterium]